MTDYTKLSNLFNAQQRLTAYNTSSKKRTDEQKELADMNGDGKINSKDKTLINNQIKQIQKDNPYDLNGDGKTNINDWLLFTDEIDLDGDGEVSDAEKSFIASQKKTMATTVQKSVVSEKYTGEFNGKMYKNGKVLTGFADDGKYYASGSLKTGNVKIKENGKKVTYYFVNGEKANGTYNNTFYVDGLKATGSKLVDGILYVNGAKAKGTTLFENILYDNGVKSTKTQVYQNSLYISGEKATGTQAYNNMLFINGDKTTETQLFENVLYVKGSKATGTQLYNNILYDNGVKSTKTQVYQNILYVAGEKATGTQLYSQTLYVDGEKAKGTQLFKDILYVDGTQAKGTVTYGDNIYVDGVKAPGGIERDEKGNITSVERYDSSNRIIYRKTCKYDDNGKLVQDKEEEYSYGEATNKIYGYKYNQAVMTNTTDYNENGKTVTLSRAEYNGSTLVGSVINNSDGTKSRNVQTSSEGWAQDSFNLKWDKDNNLTYFYKKIRTSIGYMGTVPYYSSYSTPSDNDNVLPTILEWNGKTAEELSR